MEQERRLLSIGERLILGGVEYRIEEVEGYGGSSIVYRASYPDALNTDSIHFVYIKELFPYHPKGLIYRDETGSIRTFAEGGTYMQQYRQSFYLGNQANLALLADLPEQISGNLNSYEAYGTYYSVLPIQGGESLEKLMLKGSFSLREAAICIEKILTALEHFHNRGILHLDISPDNIRIFSSYAFLIDYNSVWQIKREPGCVSFFSEKEGYTAPEVRFREIGQIGPSSDLYSVSAVFFQMLTGRKLSDELTTKRGLIRCFPKDLAVFRGEYASAAEKAVQIIMKGLHILPQKRYPTADKMLLDIKELICRIDGMGVSPATLLEGSSREWKNQKQTDGLYLSRTIKSDEGISYTEVSCIQALLEGKNILLKGAGGMGKTQFLMKLWEICLKRKYAAHPIPLYIPLVDYQDPRKDPNGILNGILQRFCRMEKTDTLEESGQKLYGLFTSAVRNDVRFLLLLDGLNEAGNGRELLLKEIQKLGAMEGVQILLTERTDSVKAYALPGFCSTELLPLTVEERKAAVLADGIPYPMEQGLQTLLANPMMLSLYRSIRKAEESNGGAAKEEKYLQDSEDMIKAYLESLCMQELRRDFGSRAKQLRHRYLFDHLLPEIAENMKKRRRTQLTVEQMYEVVKKSFRRIRKRSFVMAFPEYMGKTREMFQGIADEKEWFDYAVSEQLVMELNLLLENGLRQYRLVHDTFLTYLAARAKENRIIRMRYWIRARGIKIAAAAACISVFFVSAWSMKPKSRLSRKEQGEVYAAVQRMEINVGILNGQIRGQEQILRLLSSQGILEGNQKEMEKLSDAIDAYREEEKGEYVSYRGGKDHCGRLENLGEKIPLDIVEDLYQKPEEFHKISARAMGLLEERLCRGNGIYDTYDKRKELADAYQGYIKSYTALCGAQYSQMVLSLQEIRADESVEEMMDTASEMLAVGVYVHYNSQVEVSDELTKAKRQMNQAINEMKRQGLL